MGSTGMATVKVDPLPTSLVEVDFAPEKPHEAVHDVESEADALVLAREPGSRPGGSARRRALAVPIRDADAGIRDRERERRAVERGAGRSPSRRRA